MIYIYSLFAFFFVDDTYKFSDVFDSEGNSADENQCTSLLQCFIVTLNTVITPTCFDRRHPESGIPASLPFIELPGFSLL